MIASLTSFSRQAHSPTPPRKRNKQQNLAIESLAAIPPSDHREALVNIADAFGTTPFVSNDPFNTPWRVTAAAIYTTPTDSRVYGTLDIDVTRAKNFLDDKRGDGIKITMTHLATVVLARAVAFDVPEMNCFIRRGAMVGREHIDVTIPVAIGDGEGVAAVLIKNAHARSVTSIAEEIRNGAEANRAGNESQTVKNKYVLNRIPWPLRRPAFRFLKWLTVDMGFTIKSLGLSADSFGSFVVSDIGSFGLNTGMTSLMPAAKVPAVIVLGKIEEKPVVRDGEVVVRTMLPLTGTF